MHLIRLGLANLNSTVGAPLDNAEHAAALCRELALDHVTLAALPEQALGGYPPEDLVHWPGFVQAQLVGLARLAAATAELPMLIAVGVLAPGLGDGVIYNCAALLHRGRLVGLVPKEKLPEYSVFYETRTLGRGAPGLHTEVELPGLGRVPFGDLVFDCGSFRLALEICEDIWSPDGPMRRRCFHGAEVVVNLSASPYRIGVRASRRELVCTRASDNQATVAYVNAVGANDGLIFDGGGFVAQNGRLVHEAPRFLPGTSAVTVDLARTRRMRGESTTYRADRSDAMAESLAPGGRGPAGPQRVAVADVAISDTLRYPVPPHRSFFLPPPDGPGGPPSPRRELCEELLDAMALGVGEYFEKTRAFRHIGVALSGGRDSLLCLLIAHRYVTKRAQPLGPKAQAEQVKDTLRAFFMPTRYSSERTRRAAEVAAAELGVPLVTLSIDEAFDREAEAARAMLQPGEELTPLTLQNIQSRLRAQRMWNWSNATAGLFLQTGNMSEKAVGYTTVGGDLMGCLAPIANLPKTLVNYLLDYLLETQGLDGIRQTIAIPASAELAPNQEDERDLMPFPVLDACIALHASEKLPLADLAAALVEIFPEHPRATLAAWAEKFTRLFAMSIFKWVQAPLSLHLGNLDLERERALQLPVVTRNQWMAPPPPPPSADTPSPKK